MRLRRSLLIVTAVILIAGLVFYQINYMNLWGFTLNKNKLSKAIVHKDGIVYIVSNQDIVLDLAEKVSKMERLQKIEVKNFPPGPIAQPFGKLMLQTNENVTYGGTIWNLNGGNTMDSSGYYWNVPSEVVSTLETAIKDSHTTSLP